jgi:transposase-like protein
MARSTTKEFFWQDHICRWQQSHLSVRAFCRTHRLREPSFYHWRRLLTQRGLLAEAQSSAPPLRGRQAAESASTVPAFVPVRIEQQSVPHNAVAPAFEVVLAGGRVLRVPVDFDATALRRLIATLEDRPC